MEVGVEEDVFSATGMNLPIEDLTVEDILLEKEHLKNLCVQRRRYWVVGWEKYYFVNLKIDILMVLLFVSIFLGK